MFPVSGAEQLKISGAISDRPMISQSGAYSRLVSCTPGVPTACHKFQRPLLRAFALRRSEEHTSELQSLMRISYAVFCLKKKKKKKNKTFDETTSIHMMK